MMMESVDSTQPLHDLRVIDLSHGIAGPYCTKLLADFGADVIKVERPGSGDYARRLGPFPGDVSHPEKSGFFLFLNTNKRGITLDLKTAEGANALKDLVKEADILVESFKPGVMSRLGLDYDTLSALNPDLVMTSVSNFGQTGPYRDYHASELAFFALGGKMNSSGLSGREPLKLGGHHVQFQAGNNAAMATMFAIQGKKNSGLGGQHVDVSIFETQMGSINGRTIGLVRYQYTGYRGRREAQTMTGYPSGVYPCKDGYISVAGGGQRFPRVAASLGRPELADDPRFGISKGPQDPQWKAEFEDTIWIPWLEQRTQEDVVSTCQEHELLCTPYNTMDRVIDHNPQLDARSYFGEIDHPVAGNFRYPGSPVFNNNGWWHIRRPAPLPGQHNGEVLGRELGNSEGEMRSIAKEEMEDSTTEKDMSAPHVSAGGQDHGIPRFSLDGIRVIDMTVVLAGPYGTMFLAEQGAEVIRVETLQQLQATTRGQFARPSKEVEANQPTSSYPNRDPGERPWNRTSAFNSHARNKYSMTAELRTPEGQDIIRRLVEVSDLFIENNAVGSMERLGLTYDILSQWNPRIIMISITGFGQTGPWGTYRGIGSSFEAAYGHTSVMGYRDMGPEGSPGGVASDASTGVTVAFAAAVALHQREKTGKGMFVDISLGENFLPHLGELVMDYTINGRVAGPPGNRDPLRFVQGVYPCAGDDEWIAISIGTIEQWQALCRIIDIPELAELRGLETMSGLRAHHDDVDMALAKWTSDKDPIDLFHRLQKEGIIAGHVMHETHAYDDPHLKERDFFVEVTHPEIGTYATPGPTYRMSKVPFLIRKPPVRLGEDNDYVYRDVLKVSEREYDRLKELGHIGMDYAPHVR
ncbi:CoA transferase [SAR202 cluster bacterium AC-647-N09_OGT_505m]|nr:CoA transferase [SAR202 cluster bacterium AC-647-N09_OGT_505m]